MAESGKLSGKTAVITGASKGIGAGIALAFAKEGANVVVNYARGKDDAEKVAANIKDSGGKSITVQADVSKKADVDKLFAEATKAFGTVDILVNNAGVYEFAPLDQITEDSYRRLFDLNVLGTLLSTQAAVKAMNGGGSIINLSSVGIPYPSADQLGVQRHQGRGGCHHAHAGAGAWSAKHSRQLPRPRTGGDRRHQGVGQRRRRIQELRGLAHASRTRGRAARHCQGGRLPGVR